MGVSSNGALQRVRRLAAGVKAGHGGSLDPLASGMLPICLGEATRLAGELLAGRKAYRFVLRLGERTASGDAEGELLERCPVPPLADAQIERSLGALRGARGQVPPMYSAIKRQGTPLYRLARAGQTVPRAARPIEIERLRLCARDGVLLEFELLCSKGTYVRVLGEEIAAALGTCGRLESLRREYVEPFGGEAMVTLGELEQACAAGGPWPLLAADRAVAHLAPLRLDATQAEALRCGRVLQAMAAAPGRYRVYDAAGRFLGLGVSEAPGQLRASRLFSAPLPV